MKTTKHFIQDWGITASSEQVDVNINNPDWKDANHYKVVLKYRKDNGFKQYTTYFSMGYALKGRPTAEDVLNCLSQDVRGLADSFEEWADEYGYDSDSRSAEKMYRAINKQAQDIENWLPENAYKQFLTLEEEA